jgi:hypothetical protein
MQLRGGTTAATLLFTGAQREVTVDTDKDTLVVHDGVTAGGFPLATEEKLSDGTYLYIDDVGGGSVADSYILTPQTNTNVPNSYRNGVIFSFVTENPNTGPSSANFQSLGVKNIKYPDGSDPAPGDIDGRTTLIYDSGNDWLELQRKAAEADPQIRPVAASVSGNAMTVSLTPCTVDFRSPTLANGAVTSVPVIATESLIIPSGATLGTTNGVASRIAIVAINNAGVLELAVANTSGIGSLSEDTLINTTAISAASNSASTFYSEFARAGVPYRVVGYVDSTQAAAGVWASSPSKVQGQGGQTIIGLIPLDNAKAQATAWVNFNGTGVVAIRDSYNVSSITDNAVGDYAINFTVPMTNANYSVCDGVGPNNGSSAEGLLIGAGPAVTNDVPPTTAGFRVLNTVSGTTPFDITRVMLQVFGGK